MPEGACPTILKERDASLPPQATFDLLPVGVQGQFEREVIDVKGKGTMDTWIMDGRQEWS